MIAGFCSRMKLESFLGFATFRKTPTDLNPSERRQAVSCGRGLKDAPSANFDHARRKIQRLRRFIKTTKDAENMQGNGEIAALDLS